MLIDAYLCVFRCGLFWCCFGLLGYYCVHLDEFSYYCFGICCFILVADCGVSLYFYLLYSVWFVACGSFRLEVVLLSDDWLVLMVDCCLVVGGCFGLVGG